MPKQEGAGGPEAARQTLYTRADWDRAVAAGTLTAEDVLARLTRIAVHEFGTEGPAAYDEDGFFLALTAEGLRVEGRGKYRRAYVAVRGLGTVTWDYLCMLLGVDGVKADVWVVRFVSRALRDDTGDSSRDPAYCGELLRLAAAQLQVPATKLDHAVWAQMRQVGPADQRSTH